MRSSRRKGRLKLRSVTINPSENPRWAHRRDEKHRLREQVYVQIQTRLVHLGNILRNAGWESVPPPIRYGWIRETTLHPDVLGRKGEAVFKEVFRAVQDHCWASNKRTLNKLWNNPGKRQVTMTAPGVQSISPKRYLKLSLAARTHFAPRHAGMANYSHRNRRYHCVLARWMFEHRTYRAFINERRVILPDVKREESELEAYLNQHFFSELSRDHYRYFYVHRRTIYRSNRRAANIALQNIKNGAEEDHEWNLLQKEYRF